MVCVERQVTIGSADIPTHLATRHDRLAVERHIEVAVTVRHLLVYAADRTGEDPPTGEHRRVASPPLVQPATYGASSKRWTSAELARRTHHSIRARDALA